MIRTFDAADVEELAEHADVPVINGLTDYIHPCQALADVMTIRERFGRLEGRAVAYLGDGNNVPTRSWSRCGRKLGMRLRRRDARGLRARRRTPAGRRRPRRSGGPSSSSRIPGGRAGRRRPLHRRLDQHGPGRGARATARRLARLLIDAALVAHAAGRGRPALPPGPLRRGGHRGGPLRPAVGRLGRGGEPPARPEGADGARQ